MSAENLGVGAILDEDLEIGEELVLQKVAEVKARPSLEDSLHLDQVEFRKDGRKRFAFESLESLVAEEFDKASDTFSTFRFEVSLGQAEQTRLLSFTCFAGYLPHLTLLFWEPDRAFQ